MIAGRDFIKEIFGVEEVNRVSLYQALFAEFLGTLLLVFFGVATQSVYGERDEIQTALTYGVVTSCLIMSFGQVSGCQLNPAVSVAMMCSGSTSIIRGLLYIIMQLGGATSGAALIYCFKSNEDVALGIPKLAEGVKPEQGLFLETMATMVIVLVYLAVTDPCRPGLRSTAFLSIGIAIAGVHLATYRFTRAGLNPARSIGPALVNRERNEEEISIVNWDDQWIYWIGPLLGGIIACIIYKILLSPTKTDAIDETGEPCQVYAYGDWF